MLKKHVLQIKQFFSERRPIAGDPARLLILEMIPIQKCEPLLNIDCKFALLYLFSN